MALKHAHLDFHTLNPQQRAAVEHDGAPLLVLAGAGSGKTRVITYRIARLLLDGIPGERILGVTFTNKAAKEMRERMSELAGSRARDVQLSTFQRLGLSILKEDYEVVGLRRGFAIYDTSDQTSLLREMMRRLSVADRRLDASKVLDRVLAAKRQRLEEVPIDRGDDYEFAAHELYPRYREQMRAYNAVDFDDLILGAVDVLREPSRALKWSNRFQHILVDEYQDTSPDQLELLRDLAGDGHNLSVVGDDDQSIYARRGAVADNILAFTRQFAAAKEIVLDQNYRSTNNILRAANAVIANNAVRKMKNLWSASGDGDAIEVVACPGADEEAEFVAGTIQRLVYQGQSYQDFAILYRSNNQGRLLEETLALERIPYRVVGGQSLFDRKDVRDALAYLSFINNPTDEVSLRRVINLPPRGIGPKTLQRITEYAESSRVSLWSALRRVDRIDGLETRAHASVGNFVALIEGHADGLRARTTSGLAERVQHLFDALGLREHILESDDTAKVLGRRLENFDQVLHALRRFEQQAGSSGGLESFLRNTALARDSETEEESDVSKVTLITLHSAKGLEFPCVFLVGMEEDLLPHRRAVEEASDLGEERRLCYVGITRAQQRLWLTYASRRVRYGKGEPRNPSRFLDELPEGEGVIRTAANADGDGEEAEAAADAFFERMRSQLGIDPRESSDVPTS